SALRELEGPAGLRLAVLLPFDHAAVAGQESRGLQGRTQRGLVELQRLRDAVLDRAGLARETTAGNRRHDVELAFDIGDLERLAQDHLQHGAREVGGHFLAVDGDLARTGLDPDAGNRVLALAGGVGTAQLVAL